MPPSLPAITVDSKAILGMAPAGLGRATASADPSVNPSANPSADPYLGASTSPQSRAGRALWGIACTLLFRPSPRPAHAWRSLLLRMFGARMGPHCHVYPGARIWAPWNLVCEDAVCIADEAIVYNPAPITLRSHSVISQQAYLCGASHDIDDPAFPMRSYPIHVGRYAWIAARATVCPNVRVGDGAVLGVASVATRDLQPWGVYAGAPARLLRQRHRPEGR